MADVNAVGIERDGDIGTVVDKKQRAGFPAERAHFFSQLKKSAVVQFFGAKLQRIGAAGENGFNRLEERVPVGGFGRDGVKADVGEIDATDTGHKYFEIPFSA